MIFRKLLLLLWMMMLPFTFLLQCCLFDVNSFIITFLSKAPVIFHYWFLIRYHYGVPLEYIIVFIDSNIFSTYSYFIFVILIVFFPRQQVEYCWPPQFHYDFICIHYSDLFCFSFLWHFRYFILQ